MSEAPELIHQAFAAATALQANRHAAETATAYMCRAAKSREAYDALNAATEKIEAEQTRAVPEHLKNKHFPVIPES